MKSVLVAVSVMLFALMNTPWAWAINVEEHRAEADQYYEVSDYRNAFKVYYRLAKTGDHHSQYRISQMYANGEGQRLNLEEAYAWSTLAAESGRQELISSSEDLYELTDDKTKAQKKAEKLKKKYGKKALKQKADKQARNSYGKSNACTGSRLGC